MLCMCCTLFLATPVVRTAIVCIVCMHWSTRGWITSLDLQNTNQGTGLNPQYDHYITKWNNHGTSSLDISLLTLGNIMAVRVSQAGCSCWANFGLYVCVFLFFFSHCPVYLPILQSFFSCYVTVFKF